MPKTPIGKLPREAIRTLELPRLAPEIVEGFRALVDLTGTISDALDELGIVGVIPCYVLPPVNPGKRIAGPALTVRNIARETQIHKAGTPRGTGGIDMGDSLPSRGGATSRSIADAVESPA